MTKWTKFWDMHSGGGQKLEWAYIYIEAPEKEAEIIFQNRFNRNPHRVTCTCCGSDYSINEYDSLEEATSYHRNAKIVKGIEVADEDYGRKYISLKQAIKQGNFGEGLFGGKFLIIKAKDIKTSEKKGELKEEGYVWADRF